MVSKAGLLLVLASLASWSAQDSLQPYPPYDFGPSTSILNHSSYVAGFADPQWYLDNIPFVDFPDANIQDVYYYRTSVVHRHLKYFHQGHGWVFTEFIQPVSWASKGQTIPDSAGHHILEGRWLRDPSYVRDLIQLYTRAGCEAVTSITYTQFVHQAIYEYAQVNGDIDFLTSQLQGMIFMYGLWNVTQDPTTGLYHRTPLLDAQEFSLPGYVVGGPNMGPVQDWYSMENNYSTIDNGPQTYRISFNAYMVAAARSISSIANMTGQTNLAQEWNSTATTLLNNMQSLLYDNDINFWIDVIQGTNEPAVGRQEIGYYPYRFGIGTNESNIQGLEAGLDTEHFLTEFGPTTLEQTNPYYTALKNLTYCCLWNGQSWPFSTSIYLHVLADLARNNLSTVSTPEFFQSAMLTYAKTNYKDGVPYTAEVHYPTIDAWSGDTTNHSENYLHSTYMDNVFTDLLGILPTFDPVFQMQPLIPSNWSYWAVESLPYHDTLISIIYDSDGSHYSSQPHPTGLTIYAAGQQIYTNPFVPNTVSVPLPSNSTANSTSQTYTNILTNPNAPYSLPGASTSYVFSPQGDSATSFDAWKTIDNLLWYDLTPDNRWTANQSATPFSYLNYTLPRPRIFSSISLAILNDLGTPGGVLDCPYALSIYDMRTNALLASRSPWTTCTPNALNTIDFDTGNVTTDEIGLVFTAKQYLSLAISETQIWVPSNSGPVYEAEDSLMGAFIGGFEGRYAGGNSSLIRPSYNTTNATAGSMTDGGVVLGSGGWIEWAGVVAPPNAQGTVTVIGSGTGSVSVGVNFLRNQTVAFSGGMQVPVDAGMMERQGGLEQTVATRNVSTAAVGASGRENVTASGFEWLYGGNVVTVWWEEGMPFVDAIVVG